MNKKTRDTRTTYEIELMNNSFASLRNHYNPILLTILNIIRDFYGSFLLSKQYI